MKINRIKPIVFSFAAISLIASAFMLSGCSHSSAPGPSYDLTWALPTVKSDYIVTYAHGIPSSGTPQGSISLTYTVSNVGSFAGKTNTISLVNYYAQSSSNDKEYYALESNGDYSVLDTTSGFSPANWQTYPTSEGAAIHQSTDSIYPADGVRFLDPTHVHRDFTRSFVDVENIIPDPRHDTTYAAYKIHVVTIEHDSDMSFQHPAVTDTLNTDCWIAPTIGWIVKDSTYGGSVWTTKILNGTYQAK